MIAIRNQQNFQLNRLEYLKEAMSLYGTYSFNNIHKIVDDINQLHKNISYHEKIYGKISHWYKKNYYEWRISHVVLNSLLYLQDLKMKYINTYKDLLRKLNTYTNAIHIFSTWYLPLNLMFPSQLNEMVKQVERAVVATKSQYDIALKRLH